MNETEKFLDSYAIIEILNQKPQYARFASATGVCTAANLVEVAYHLLSETTPERTRLIMDSLRVKVLEIPPDAAVEIAAFRKKHAKKKLSYIDCVGYVVALRNNIPFVTGDKEFEKMPNVEFVK
ncbi:MAG: PIN domain-containing protein [Candidatus Diapherotrites archaeon]|nr:PIN domain-containing protein [Candidatus Diapherotrites archaeon]